MIVSCLLTLQFEEHAFHYIVCSFSFSYPRKAGKPGAMFRHNFKHGDLFQP